MSDTLRILVTGANGQVGHELLRALKQERIPSRASRAFASLPPSQAKGEDDHPLRNEGGRAQRGGMASADTNPPQPPVESEGGGLYAIRHETGRPPARRGGALPCEVIPATRNGTLEDGAPCECIDLADLQSLSKALDRIAPDLIVNAAAYTAVDRAEDEPDLAQRINGEAVGALGAWATQHGARVVHYSTDYVFDGTATAPYREADATRPLGVYGRTKLAGEIALRESGARHLVFRTAWVYAARGHNFLRTMLRLGAERAELRVVDDQIGAPTPARLIADVTAHAIASWYAAEGDQPEDPDGIYNLVASGQTSWCGFTRAIFERAHRAGLLARVPRVQAIRTADYPTRATRPAYSVLDTEKLCAAFGATLPDWQTALGAVIDELAAAGF